MSKDNVKRVKILPALLNYLRLSTGPACPLAVLRTTRITRKGLNQYQLSTNRLEEGLVL